MNNKKIVELSILDKLSENFKNDINHNNLRIWLQYELKSFGYFEF